VGSDEFALVHEVRRALVKVSTREIHQDREVGGPIQETGRIDIYKTKREESEAQKAGTQPELTRKETDSGRGNPRR